MRKRLLMAGPMVALLLLVGIWRPTNGSASFDSRSWMESGLAQEMSGDLPHAEQSLLEAARIDHLYQPRWTLAGFYFRHPREAEFWKWSRLALEVGTRNLGALFDLCWQFGGDAESIWRNAVPERPVVWREYLQFLTESKRWPAAAFAARKLAAVGDEQNKSLLLSYVDLALEQHREYEAWPVWQEMARNATIPYEADKLLTNGNFAHPLSGRGFDWLLPNVPQVRNDIEPDGIRFTLSGFQPESCVLLEQPLALPVGREYHLRFEYRTDRIKANSGLHWEFAGAPGAGLSSSEWTGGQMTLRAGTGKLAFVYQRAPGSTMADGVVFLRRMDITPQ